MPLDHRTPVLVVDDEPVMSELMARILTRLGFRTVECAGDGYNALARMREVRFGAVICDWAMEPLNGYDLLKCVRADPDLRDTPFIIATTRTAMGQAVAAKVAGVDRYLVKPFTTASLRQTLDCLRDPEQSSASPSI